MMSMLGELSISIAVLGLSILEWHHCSGQSSKLKRERKKINESFRRETET